MRDSEHSERGRGLDEDREAQGPSDARGSPASGALFQRPCPSHSVGGRGGAGRGGKRSWFLLNSLPKWLSVPVINPLWPSVCQAQGWPKPADPHPHPRTLGPCGHNNQALLAAPVPGRSHGRGKRRTEGGWQRPRPVTRSPPPTQQRLAQSQHGAARAAREPSAKPGVRTSGGLCAEPGRPPRALLFCPLPPFCWGDAQPLPPDGEGDRLPLDCWLPVFRLSSRCLALSLGTGDTGCRAAGAGRPSTRGLYPPPPPPHWTGNPSVSIARPQSSPGLDFHSRSRAPSSVPGSHWHCLGKLPTDWLLFYQPGSPTLWMVNRQAPSLQQKAELSHTLRLPVAQDLPAR